MSTAAIIVIIAVVVIVVIALLLMLPRMRERARIRGRERELDQRRDRVVTAHREEAADRERRAEVAEQRARVAEQEAQRERAAAQVREEQAELHERGLADDELISEDEREDFAGTSAVSRGRDADIDAGEPRAAATTESSVRADRPAEER
jgi:FtsZ-interacting cell division protein ZipA